MNVIAWAANVLRETPEATVEARIAKLTSLIDPTFFDRPDVRTQFFKWLVKDAMRSLKVPSVPVEPEEQDEETEPDQPRLLERTYREDSLLSIADVRWILKECRQTIGQNMAKGRRYMRLAISKGWRELRDEYPEFDPEVE